MSRSLNTIPTSIAWTKLLKLSNDAPCECIDDGQDGKHYQMSFVGSVHCMNDESDREDEKSNFC